MYEYADKVILYMKKRFIRLFSQFKSRASFDELNVIQSSKTLYDELLKITEECLLMIAKRAYTDHGGKNVDAIDLPWLLGWFDDYHPVTKYVFTHEVERKCSRFAESVIASPNKAKEIETALRYWSNMVAQYALDVVDKAVQTARVENGVVEVRWVTVKDERRCTECRARHNKVYDIAKVPPKPHLGCRCYLLPHLGGNV